jgi:hypothetical protein
MTHPQVLSDEQIIELAVECNLGRKLRPLGNHESGNVFYTDASYRTPELIDLARAIESATLEALAKQEPFGYFKAEPFGWTDCASTDEGAVALYERPQKSA